MDYSSAPAAASPSDNITIVGAGCFGISTAYHFLKRGFQNITIIERSDELPAKDGSSNDINRIVRTSYPDPFYAQLAIDAIKSWKGDVDIWGDSYHESGVLVVGGSPYADQSYISDVQNGLRLQKLANSAAIRQCFTKDITVGEISHGYLNRDSGWADAGKATLLLTQKVIALGGRLISGKRCVKLVRKDGKTEGVECHDGTIIASSLIILAAGPWSPSVFPELEYKDRSHATGQGIAMVQLTQEEADRYREVPVFTNFGTGFYCFPPTENNIVKMAIHAPGFTHIVNQISTPRTVITHPEDGLFIPRPYARRLREEFAAVYPELAKKAFSNTRLCWYNDTSDGDWIIGRHPTDSSIFFATGGSGHAFKFLPVIGRVVADAVQGLLEPQLMRKFAFDREMTHDTSRDIPGMTREELDTNDLCGPEI